MRKFILAATVAASLAVPTAAMADQPVWNGTFDPNPSANAEGNLVGVYSSRVTHNGIAIATTEAQAGARGADIQQLQLAQGQGSLAH